MDAQISQVDWKNRAEKVLGKYPQAIMGDAVKAFEVALNISDADREWVRTWLTDKYNVRF